MPAASHDPAMWPTLDFGGCKTAQFLQRHGAETCDHFAGQSRLSGILNRYVSLMPNRFRDQLQSRSDLTCV